MGLFISCLTVVSMDGETCLCSRRKLTEIPHGCDDVDDELRVTVSTDISSTSSKSMNPETILTIQCDWEKIKPKEDHHHPISVPHSDSTKLMMMNIGSDFNKTWDLSPVCTTPFPQPPLLQHITIENREEHRKTAIIIPPKLPECEISSSKWKKDKSITKNGRRSRLEIPKNGRMGRFEERSEGVKNGKGCLIGAKCSFKVELIDDTILIQSPSVIRKGVYDGKKVDFLKDEVNLERMGGKNGRRWGVKEGMGGGGFSGKGGKNGRLIYSRKEMELLRYKNGVSQRKMWNEIHHALGPVGGKAYDELGARHKQQKCRRSGSGALLLPGN